MTNETSGATGVMARRAAAIQGDGNAAIGGEVGVDADDVIDRRSEDELRTLERRRLNDCIAQYSTGATYSDRVVAGPSDLVDAMRCGRADLGSAIADQGGAVHDTRPRLDNSENRPTRSMVP